MSKRETTPDGEEKVGYKNPPKRTQFQPGKSGNPRGRPKGSNNLKADVIEMLNTLVSITEGDKKRKVSTQRAMLLRLREKALKGDAKAIERLVALAQTHNNEELEKDASNHLDASDAEILKLYNQRMSSSIASNAEDEVANREQELEEEWHRSGLSDECDGDDSWLN